MIIRCSLRTIDSFKDGYWGKVRSPYLEGAIYPPCEGGLKVGADFNFQVSLREVTHPNLPSFREGVIFLPFEGG